MKLITIIAFLLTISTLNCQSLLDFESEVYSDFPTIVTKHGYSVQSHTVTTEDGYVLTLFRIPSKLHETRKKYGPPVLLQHGIFDSSDGWVSRGDESPAFILVDSGYDVWLSNSRGNKYSRKHLSLNPDKGEDFWKFSWDQMGEYDLPACIDYILKNSQYEKIAYVAHSMGNNIIYSILPEKLEYFQSTISVIVSLAPAVNITSPEAPWYQVFDQWFPSYYFASKLAGNYQMFSSDFIQQGVLRITCSVFPKLCDYPELLFSESNIDVNDDQGQTVYIGHYFQGQSLQCVHHFYQLRTDRVLKRYDYIDYLKNQKAYGQRSPPVIDLKSKKNIPIAIFSGTLDLLVNSDDQKHFSELLGDDLVYYGEHKLGHLSFLVAKDMSYFQKDVINLLKKYHPCPTAVLAQENIEEEEI